MSIEGYSNDFKEVTLGKLTFRIYDDNTAKVVECEKDAVEIEVPTLIEGVPVTSIGDRAFVDCKLLKKVTLPQYDLDRWLHDEMMFEEIGDNAFYRCCSLEEIIIPEKVSTIGHGAFAQCTALQKVVFGDPLSPPYLYPYAFSGCESLVDISPVRNASEGLFDECKSLTDLPLQECVGKIEERCFAHCTSLKEIVISENIMSIESLAFRSCFNLKKVTFKRPDGWSWSSMYSGGGNTLDLGDPERNAKMLRTADFDDGVHGWHRKL